jgi:hypothetical protein
MAQPSLQRARIGLASIALAFALAPPARAAWPHDHRTPLRVLTGTGAANQVVEAAIPDGSGGAFVFLRDDRTGLFDLYAVHIRGDGTHDPTWPALGLPLTLAAGNQYGIRALDDGAGGIWVVWTSDAGTPRIFATRMLKTGAIDPDFPANGFPLDVARANGQHDPSLCLNPNGSLVAAWEYDFSPTDHDIYGASINAAAVLQWSTMLHTGLAMDIKPDISPESGVFSIVWNNGSACEYVRHSYINGAQVGSVQTIASPTEPLTAPRACPDGWNGTYVAGATKPGGSSAIVVKRMLGGTLSLDYGQQGAFQAAPYQVKLVYCGNFQAWLAWSHDATNSVSLRWLDRDTQGSVNTLPPILGTPQMQLVSDDAGGALLAVQYFEIGGTRIKATRYNSTGANPSGFWFPFPVPVMQLVRDVNPAAMCSDGSAGALVFGNDASLTPSAAHVIRVDRWGALDGAPLIQSVKDVANDQGGLVRIAWQASYLDRETQADVDSYRLWRQVPVASLGASRLLAAHAVAGASPDALVPGAIRLAESATASYAWELLATQVANAFPSYSLTVATVSDSASGGPANTIYMVEARDSNQGIGWASPPDSGHSVDNLPPATPAPFTGSVMGGASTQLTWGANSESDLAGYELHRGSSPGFLPGPGNLVASTTATNFLDSGEVGDHYKLAAVDTHGNRSGYALVTPSGTLAAPGDRVPAALALDVASANPSRDGATFRYALPVAGTARLELFDVHGRLVREWSPGERGPGEYVEPWDGREGSGTIAASGVYFVRLRFAGRQLLRRVVLAH